jgi:hypothetical protein
MWIRVAVLVVGILCGGMVGRQVAACDSESDYQEVIKRGESAENNGQLLEALRFFERASKIDFFEAPNYAVVLRIAKVQCKLGARDEGLARLDAFECMLDVEVGVRKCYEPLALTSDAERKPGVHGECFERMCSDSFLDHYEDVLEEIRVRVQERRRDADEVRKLCRGEAGR